MIPNANRAQGVNSPAQGQPPADLPTPHPVAPAQYASLSANAGLLRIGCVFAVVGGYLDAFAYLAHGHVFANTQTGNVVFLGLALAHADWLGAARHLPSIAAFAAGVTVAKLLGVKPEKHRFHATLLCQAIELAALVALSLAGTRLPDHLIVPILAFVAALQNTSFNRIGEWSFNSVMTTGNLLNALSGLVDWARRQQMPGSRDKALSLGAIILSFFLGAIAGGWFTLHSPPHALLPGVALVALGVLLTLKERAQALHPPA